MWRKRQTEGESVEALKNGHAISATSMFETRIKRVGEGFSVQTQATWPIWTCHMQPCP